MEALITAWRTLADPLGIGLAVVQGPDHVIRYCNPAFADLTDGDGEAAGRSLSAVVRPVYRDALLPLLDEPSPDAASRSVDVDLSGEPGEGLLHRCTVHPLRAPGVDDGAVIQVQDESPGVESLRRHVEMEQEIREVNQRLVLSALREQELAEEAQVAAQAKSDFLSAVSHELRTPLTAIVGYSEVLETEAMGPLNEQQQKSVERIRVSAAHLRELISDLLDFQRREADSLAAQIAPAEACEIAREALSIVRGLAVGRLDLRQDLEDHEIPLETDPGKLRQVLVNLLGNAIKFTDEGWVELRLRDQGETVLFAVRDSGIGIDAAELERIFQPFTQLDRGYTRTVEGTGLGLSIARQIVAGLGGELSVESTPGEGSTFTLVVPRRPESADQA